MRVMEWGYSCCYCDMTWQLLFSYCCCCCCCSLYDWVVFHFNYIYDREDDSDNSTINNNNENYKNDNNNNYNVRNCINNSNNFNYNRNNDIDDNIDNNRRYSNDNGNNNNNDIIIIVKAVMISVVILIMQTQFILLTVFYNQHQKRHLHRLINIVKCGWKKINKNSSALVIPVDIFFKMDSSKRTQNCTNPKKKKKSFNGIIWVTPRKFSFSVTDTKDYYRKWYFNFWDTILFNIILHFH